MGLAKAITFFVNFAFGAAGLLLFLRGLYLVRSGVTGNKVKAEALAMLIAGGLLLGILATRLF